MDTWNHLLKNLHADRVSDSDNASENHVFNISHRDFVFSGHVAKNFRNLDKLEKTQKSIKETFLLSPLPEL